MEESAKCDVLLSVGTSGLVYPAAMLPYMALQNGATVVEINPSPSPLAARADFALTGAAGKILPDLVAALNSAIEQPSA
jgi:NAD-dependent deacetylase